MAKIVRRKRSQKPRQHPLNEPLAELGVALDALTPVVSRDLLGPIEDGIHYDPSDLDEVILACEQIAGLGRRLAAHCPDAGAWTAADLYNRSLGNRRIMFLELLAWAVAEAENQPTAAAFATFERELQRSRMANGWGPLPWPKADKDPDRFARYVLDLANGFTALGGGYVGRLGAD